MIDENGSTIFTSKHKEEPLREGDDHPDFIHAYNAYTPPGTVEGDLVYVHYARVEDLKQLKDWGIDLKGKICMARYGKIFRGNKIKHCQDAGAIGVILFSDPGDVAAQGTDPENVYPNTIFLPGSGIQRGGTSLLKGDPLSPTWASVPNAYRIEPEEVQGLPQIPTQPIGYDDAKVLLDKMGGDEVSPEWRGNITGITYRLGGVMEPSAFKVRLSTHNHFGNVKSSNILGYIKGSTEPDRYVFLSNHRDAWGYGAVDPSSGTAQLMEVARSFGNLLKSGWRPRRTIVLASFAAEESGLEGSHEWVHHHTAKLMSRTVGLVNTDICVSGPIVKPQASPVLKDIVINALKMADDPTTEGSRKYYEYWDEWTNQDKSKRVDPKVSLLGSGSDHAPFAFFANIPAINLRFKDDSKKHKGVGQYPTYHTGYETFYLMDEIIDPGFKIHRTCAQTSLHLLMEMADSSILPYNLERFPQSMKETLATMDAANVTKQLMDNHAGIEYLKEAVDNFENATQKFMIHLQRIKKDLNPLELRIANDQMMQLERVFNMPYGIPDRPEIRNAIFAPSKFNTYGGAAFPGISDLLHEIDDLPPQDHVKRWKEVKKHVSDLMIMINEAARFLNPVHEI